MNEHFALPTAPYEGELFEQRKSKNLQSILEHSLVKCTSLRHNKCNSTRQRRTVLDYTTRNIFISILSVPSSPF